MKPQSLLILVLLLPIPASETTANSEQLALPEKPAGTTQVDWLISEYHRSTSEGYSVWVLKSLSAINDPAASDFVVSTVLKSTDPTLKLTIAHAMREAGNSGSLDIMRGWKSVESGDFDLIVAKRYLKAIIAFGDKKDCEFLAWLEANAGENFHPDDFTGFIAPLLARVKEKGLECSF